jgi:hypothetical protein
LDMDFSPPVAGGLTVLTGNICIGTYR